MNLYWATTRDGNENWFVVAKMRASAARFHESAEGYERNDASATIVCEIPAEIWAKHKANQEVPDWPSHELLRDAGAQIETVENPRVVNINGKVYEEGNFVEGFFLNDHAGESGVYVLKVQGTEKYKIGKTKNLAQRIRYYALPGCQRR